MARVVVEAKLQNRTARERLTARTEPYWRTIGEGAHIGYYRGARFGRWVARFRKPGAAGGYAKTTLGEADDVLDPDGERILSFAQAQEKARGWFDTMARDGRRPAGQPYTVGDALDDYMANFGGKSVTATKSRVEAIIRPALGTIHVDKLTSTQIADWHKQRAKSPAKLRTGKFAKAENVRELADDDAARRRRSTANRDLTVLKAALNRAFREGLVRSDEAWRKVLPFKAVDAAKVRYLTDAEARRLVNAMDPAFRPMAQAAMLTGARYGSLAKARVRDFDPQSNTLTLPDTKGGRTQIVYLEDEGAALFTRAAAGKLPTALLFTHPSGRRWGPSEQARYLDAACTAGKVERATFHDLRRTYGARLARAGVPMAVIAEALGHADERMTRKHYAHLAPSYVSATIRQHAAGLGIVERDNVQAIA
ncbi:site-specific integrase [uncultured Sphingomonas sp.]|uniref:tyrosine-type recombinase/integrase n=1 Tax=uncultured Sphingomonas sp. TaxID=158754 RepID=UPI00258BCA25|nr:site-specific integrase [uncultured Sphingomonas sp.]